MASTTAKAIRLESALAAIAAEMEQIEPSAAETIQTAMEIERTPDDRLIAALETITGILQYANSKSQAEEEESAEKTASLFTQPADEQPAAVPAEPLTARQRRQRAAAEQEPGQ